MTSLTTTPWVFASLSHSFRKSPPRVHLETGFLHSFTWLSQTGVRLAAGSLEAVLEQDVLIYDGDCAFCQRCVDWGTRNLAIFPQALSYASIQPERYGLGLADVEQSIWLVDVDAPLERRQRGLAQWSGHVAAARILLGQPLKSRFGFVWRALGVAIILGGPISAAAYRAVARNRHRMPGATAACELPEQDTTK